jgi:hypothetical protein
MNEIRAYAVEGIRRLSRGGVEQGGVLFGARAQDMVRILTWRPIECEHASGPAFHLSQNDRILLGQFLQTSRSDKDLSGLHPVGWFVAHARDGISLTETDLKTYNHFFPWSWQVTLVLEPSKDGSAKAGFFFRDAQGEIKADTSLREFAIGPSAIPPRSPTPPDTVISSLSPAPSSLPSTPKRYPPEARNRLRLADSRLWIWAVPLLLALLVGVMLIPRPGRQSSGTPLTLRIADAGGELRLEWDKASESIRDAVRGTLEIRDGTTNLTLPLDAKHLREGSYTYNPKSGDLEVRLTVVPVNGAPVQESARFLGTLTNPADDSAQLRRQRDELAGEVKTMREQLQRLTVRNKELEEAIRVLQNRVQAAEQTRRPQP